MSALLSCWVLPARAEDAATRAELASLRDSTKPADILRTLQLRYPDQPDAWHQFWANLTVEGLKKVVLSDVEVYLAGMRRMATADAEENVVLHVLDRLVERSVLRADSPFVSRLRPVLEEIDRTGQARIAELREQAQQAREQAQQADERIQQARRNIEFWSNMAKRFEAIE